MVDLDIAEDGDPQPPENHALGGGVHDASTRAAINALVSDANLESETGAQAKADSAESSAESYADGEIESHRQNETHATAQPPETHGDTEHDNTVPSQSDVDAKADDPHNNSAHSENYTTSSEAANAAPVQSVNGSTGNVTVQAAQVYLQQNAPNQTPAPSDGGGIWFQLDSEGGTEVWNQSVGSNIRVTGVRYIEDNNIITNDRGSSLVVTAGDTISDADGVAAFINTANGTIENTVSLGPNPPESPPAAVNSDFFGRVVVGTSTGKIALFDEDGNLTTTNPIATSGAIGASPAVSDGGNESYFGGESGGVVRVTTSGVSGDFNTNVAGVDSGLIFGDSNNVYVGDRDGTIHDLDGTSLNTNRQSNIATARFDGGLTQDGNKVYGGSWDNNVYAIRKSDLGVDWTFNAGAQVETPAGVDAGRGSLYIGTNETVYSLDTSNGAENWAFNVPNPFEVVGLRPIGNVVVITDRNDLAIGISKETGASVWQYQIGDDGSSNIIERDGDAIFGARDAAVRRLSTQTVVGTESVSDGSAWLPVD